MRSYEGNEPERGGECLARTAPSTLAMFLLILTYRGQSLTERLSDAQTRNCHKDSVTLLKAFSLVVLVAVCSHGLGSELSRRLETLFDGLSAG